MTESRFDPEDEAFTEIERRAKQRMELVKVAVSTNPYRNQVIEEVAQYVENMKGFDNINGLARCIREMKQ